VKKSHRILQVLAEAPEGLLTSEVAAAIDEADAVNNVSALLTYAVNCSRVVKVSGGAGAGEATWKLTRHGLDYLSEILAEQADGYVAKPLPTTTIAAEAPTLRRPAAKTNGHRYGGILPPIESGVPVPDVRRPGNKYRAAALTMKRGDRIVFTGKTEAHALGVQLRKEGFSAAVRRLDDGRYGVWKVK
jgi:hypothetical protein